MTPQLGPLNDWNLNIQHFAIPVAPATMQTAAEGIFAIGDVASYPGKLKLILTGFAEASVAAHNAHGLVFPGKEIHFIHSTTKGVPV
jgi:thioredoxin reductase (NADPH)